VNKLRRNNAQYIMLYLVNVQVNCRQQEGAESIKFKNNSTK